MDEKLKNEIQTRLNNLIARGEIIARTIKESSEFEGYEIGASIDAVTQFLVQSKTTISDCAGESSIFSQSMNKVSVSDATASYSDYPFPFIKFTLGILLAFRDDLVNDYIYTVEERLRESIHDDFLTQAKTLQDKFPVAAMVLAGGVLEDHLKNLCIKANQTWAGKGSISTYNDLLNGKTYQKATWRRIQVIGDLRNFAAHGEGGKVSIKEVEESIPFIERFLSDYPA